MTTDDLQDGVIVKVERDLGDDSLRMDVRRPDGKMLALYVDVGGPLDDAHLNVEVIGHVPRKPNGEPI